MPTADNSFTARIQFKKSRTLSVFHKLNPIEKEGGSTTFPEEESTDRSFGERLYTVQPTTAPRYIETCCSTD